jgi:hypothetical protein
MSNAGHDRIRITKEEVEQGYRCGAPPALVTGGSKEPRARGRKVAIAVAIGGGILILLAIVLLFVLRETPNERCWKELSSVVRLAEGGQGSPERANRILIRLKAIQTSDVTDGDLLEAYDLSVKLFQYAVDYPDGIEGYWKAFEEGLFLRLDKIKQHLEVEDKVERLAGLWEVLERRYGR